MICRLRTRPPVFAGQSPPIFTQRIRMTHPRLRFGNGTYHLIGAFAVEEDSLPQLEIHHEPESIVMRARTTAVFGREQLDGVGVEQPARARTAAEDEFVD